MCTTPGGPRTSARTPRRSAHPQRLAPDRPRRTRSCRSSGSTSVAAVPAQRLPDASVERTVSFTEHASETFRPYPVAGVGSRAGRRVRRRGRAPLAGVDQPDDHRRVLGEQRGGGLSKVESASDSGRPPPIGTVPGSSPPEAARNRIGGSICRYALRSSGVNQIRSSHCDVGDQVPDVDRPEPREVEDHQHHERARDTTYPHPARGYDARSRRSSCRGQSVIARIVNGMIATA